MDNATVIERLRSTFPGAIGASSEFRDLSVEVRSEALVDVARFLRDDPELSYVFLENLCGVDYLGRDPRFEVVYHLLSYQNRHRLVLKVGLPEQDPTAPTVSGIWATANWQEREAYDMFGIKFS